MRWTLAAVALSLLGAALVIAPVVLSPGDTIVCGWVHPDCLGNHWLLTWVAERVAAGQSLVHNDRRALPRARVGSQAGLHSEQKGLTLVW